MEILAFSSVSLFSLAAFIAGVHLILLSRKTGKLPECLLGLALVVSLTGNIVFVSGLDTALADYAWSAHLVQAGLMVVNVGFAFMALFNLRVYRRNSRGATVLTWFWVALLIGTQWVTWALLDHVDRYHPGWYWLKYGLRAGVYAWGAAEAFRYHALMARRVRVGLAEPVLANRFLVWGIASVLGVLMLTAFEVGDYYGYQSGVGDAALITASVVGAPAAALYWVTFFAGRGYRRRIVWRARA